MLAARRQTFARHSRERLRSSFRRTPESSSFLLTSFPRKRESMLTLFLEVQGFHSPCGRAGHFLCLCKESNQRNTPPVARSPGILPCECASRFRGALSAHPCARSALARIVRAPLRAVPPPARRVTGGPVRAASCRRSSPLRSSALRQVCIDADDRTDAVQGCTGSCTTGAVRGAEHRRLRGISPQGRGDGSPRSRSSTGTVLSERPREDEKRRAVRFARCESDRRVRCLAFWLLLGNAKSNRLARRARRSFALEIKSKELDSGLRRNDELCNSGPRAGTASPLLANDEIGPSTTAIDPATRVCPAVWVEIECSRLRPPAARSPACARSSAPRTSIWD